MTDAIEYPTYGEQKVVRSTPCGNHAVGTVVFKHFDAVLSEFHNLEVHWTKVFTYLRAHGEDEVVAVRWAHSGPFAGDASFASWQRDRDGRYRIVVGCSKVTVLEELAVTNQFQSWTDADPKMLGFPGLDELRAKAAGRKVTP